MSLAYYSCLFLCLCIFKWFVSLVICCTATSRASLSSSSQTMTPISTTISEGPMTREEIERHLELKHSNKPHFLSLDVTSHSLPDDIFSHDNSNPGWQVFKWLSSIRHRAVMFWEKVSSLLREALEGKMEGKGRPRMSMLEWMFDPTGTNRYSTLRKSSR